MLNEFCKNNSKKKIVLTKCYILCFHFLFNYTIILKNLIISIKFLVTLTLIFTKFCAKYFKNYILISSEKFNLIISITYNNILLIFYFIEICNDSIKS